MQIRQGKEEDLDRIAWIHAQSWHQTYTGLIDQVFLDTRTPQDSRRRLRLLRHQAFLVVEDQRQLWGFLSFEINRQCGEIHALYLLSQAQGRGWGRALMQEALRQMRQQGCREIVLWVLPQNLRAVRFYKKAGFCADGAQQWVRYGQPVRIVRMRYQKKQEEQS